MKSRSSVFFFNATATTEIYTLSLHDALPIYRFGRPGWSPKELLTSPGRSAYHDPAAAPAQQEASQSSADRKSTRLNSSHTVISYAVFCLKKKKKKNR